MLQLAMITKNSADTIVECLNSYKQVIKFWTILDTGSTDGTQNLIKETLKDIPGKLFEEPFKGFSESRNRCLDLIGTTCKYTIMPDDSYVLFNQEKLVNQLCKKDYPVVCIKILTKNDLYPLSETSYISKRITLSKCGIRYVGKIHEDIEYAEDITLEDCYLLDCPKGTQHSRTMNRKESDLLLLGSDPRSIYYKAMTYLTLKKLDLAFKEFEKRVNCTDTDYEEKFVSWMNLGHLTKEPKFYLQAAIEFPNRRGEAYLFLYLVTQKSHWIKQAKGSPLGTCRLPVELSIYNKWIPETYNSLFS
jgi:glycosyltransferase involved in cell wall biosynthesis